MKNFTTKYVSRLLFALFWYFLFQSSAVAQTDSFLSWDTQVGCITYDSSGNPNNPQPQMVFTEDIQNTTCVKVCEFSNVVYTVHGANIINVQWTVAGGTLTTSGAGNTIGTVNWSGAGDGYLDVVITYQKNVRRHISVCIEKINSPKANFKFYGPDGGNNFCLNSPINFQNLSVSNGGSDIVNYSWDFGDGSYSTLFEPTHNYTQPGTYPVQLTVTNNCSCAATYTLNVVISNTPAAVINHAAVICQNNDVHTYSVDAACNGEWSVVGGTMQNVTGTSVGVVWNNVDANGFGYVSYRSSCTCTSWTTIKIPVIKTVGAIDGDKNLCLNEQGLYSLPSWPSTQYIWTLSGSSLNSIVATDQRNEIFIDALEAGTYTLSCHYTNTILGCSGDAVMQINILKPIVITGAANICSGTTTTYSSNVGSVQWVLKNGSTTVVSSTGTTFTYPFPTAGIYTLTATSSAYCSDQKLITVEQTPTAPTDALTGETKVCPGQPYQYTYSNTDPNSVPVWSVTNGTIVGPNTGNSVTILFNANATSYTVSVQKRSTGPLGCLSTAKILIASPIILNPVITNNSGATAFCTSSQSSFTVNLGGISPDLIEWTITPSSLGNIVSGANSNVVTVNWNEISGGITSGTINVRIKKCNPDVTKSFNVTLLQNPVLTLNAPTSVCNNSGSLTVSLATPGITNGTITWNFGNGVTQNTAVNSTGSYTFTNPYSAPATAPTTPTNMNYVITASINSPNGCGVLRASDTIIAYPDKLITITPGSNFIVCPATYNSLTLYSNGGTGISQAVSYKWYKNGNSVGSGISYTITGATPGGTYYVEVTDVNGCIARSQDVTVTEQCPPTGDTCVPPPNITLTGTWSECDKISAQVSYTGGTALSVEWQGSQFLTPNGSNQSSAYYITTVPGVHVITVKITFQAVGGGTCVMYKSVSVTKNYTADFNTTTTCNSGTNLTYNITLQNNSTAFNPSNLTYTFSGPGLLPTVGQTVPVSNLAPGTYNYTLTITSPNKPTCTIVKSITLAPLPNLNFSLSDVNYCPQEPVTLTIPNYNSAYNYSWHFGNNVYNASSATTIVNVTGNGQVPITLQSTNPYGCVISSNPINVNVSSQVFNGTLSATPPVVCTGTSAVITYAPGSGATPQTYIWMNGNQQVATTSAPTYSPNSTGTYWVRLVSAAGCLYNGAGNASVTIIPKPTAGITGNSNICAGDGTVLQGNVSASNVERRWVILNPAPTPLPAPDGTWTAATTANLNYTVPSTLAADTYTYSLEVRYANGTGCTTEAYIPVVVSAATPTPVLNFSVLNCEPYKVQINVANPVSGGVYNWSNGDTGSSITVTNGGAYSVTLTSSTGSCDASSTITVPHPFSWDFPAGFYTMCLNAVPTPYILAPLGTVDSYQWLVNSLVATQGTNSNVQNQLINQVGNYQLIVNNDGCTYESEILTVAPLESCNYPKCKVNFTQSSITYSNGQYHISCTISNTNNFPVTFTMSSFNNYGTYSPVSVTVPANGTVTLSSLNFTPNANFDGGADFIIIQMAGCYSSFNINFPVSGAGITSRLTPAQPAVMNINPNPAQEFTTVYYDLGSEYTEVETLTVYSLLGVPLATQNLKQLSGKVELATAMLPSGTYIVSIQANGKRAIQQTLIKN